MLSDDVAEKGYALMCMAVPQTDVKIRVVSEVCAAGALQLLAVSMVLSLDVSVVASLPSPLCCCMVLLMPSNAPSASNQQGLLFLLLISSADPGWTASELIFAIQRPLSTRGQTNVIDSAKCSHTVDQLFVIFELTNKQC